MKELKNTLGWFFRQTRGYHSAFCGICLTGILRICAQLGFVWILKRLVDIATGRSDSSLYLSIGLMVIILLCQLSFSALTYRQREIIRVKLGNHLRSVLFSSVMRSQWMGREGSGLQADLHGEDGNLQGVVQAVRDERGHDASRQGAEA